MHSWTISGGPKKVYAAGMAIDSFSRLIRVTLAALSAQMVSNVSWAAQDTKAARVTITRDDWGIAHVKGETDADAVFGMIYAQAEDDFNRVETHYLTNLG